MKLLGLISCASVCVALLGASEPRPSASPGAAPPAPPAHPAPPSDALSTERHVHGVITAVEPAIVTIASKQRSITGKIDPARTKVTLHGKPATLADLKVTDHAKAELCLDDVWISIDAH
jgi:hypothetical protein